MLVFEDFGFLPAICMYPQVDKREAALHISMPFTLTFSLAI